MTPEQQQLALYLLAGAIFLVGAYLYTDFTSQITSLTDQNQALNQTTITLQANLTSKNQQVASLNNEVTTLTTTKTYLESLKTSLENQLSATEQEKLTLENEKTNLENTIASKTTEITSLTNTIANKENEIATQKTELTTKLAEITTMQNTLTSKNAELVALQTNITAKIQQINNKNTEITSLENDIATKTQQLNTVRTELDQWEAKVEGKLNWFGANSNIAGISEYADIRSDLLTYCTKTENGSCFILLSCLPFINKEHGMAYHWDRGDNVQSLKETFTNDGGDCDDWAVLVQAEINYLDNNCASPPIFEAFTYSFGDFHKVTYTKWKDGKWWAWTNSITTVVPKAHKYPYAVCSTTHCLIGFLNAGITKSSDIESATQQTIVEAQNGEQISEPFTISRIITKNDMYDNYGTVQNQNWQGFEDYLIELNDIRGECS